MPQYDSSICSWLQIYEEGDDEDEFEEGEVDTEEPSAMSGDDVVLITRPNMYGAVLHNSLLLFPSQGVTRVTAMSTTMMSPMIAALCTQTRWKRRRKWPRC
jgi:hypothetical protein